MPNSQQPLFIMIILSFVIAVTSCGNIETETVVLDKNNPPDTSLLPPDTITDPVTSNNPIEISSQSFAVENGKNINIDLSTLVTDFDATKEYNYLIITPPSNGLVSIQTELLTYTPTSTGTDLIEFKVSSDDGESNVGQLNITINTPTSSGGNSALELLDTNLNVTENQEEILNLSSIIKSFDGSKTYNFIIAAQPTIGTVTLNGLILTYTPNTNTTGNDFISLRAGDGSSTSDIAKISIIIQDLSNSTPKLENKEFAVKINTPVDIDLLTLLLAPHPFESKTYTFEVLQQGKTGTGVISGTTLTYTPLTNAIGTDTSLRVLVTDDQGQTEETNITFNIAP